MPRQKPGRSRQDYGTPLALIEAVEARWGKLEIDLAASAENAKAPSYFDEGDDYLSVPFVPGRGLADSALCWCNPPFANLGPWAKKWSEDACLGARIIALVPASIGSEWFAAHCEDVAKVVALRPRLVFEGCKDPYPKDCMLLLFGRGFEDTPAFSTWRWWGC